MATDETARKDISIVFSRNPESSRHDNDLTNSYAPHAMSSIFPACSNASLIDPYFVVGEDQLKTQMVVWCTASIPHAKYWTLWLGVPIGLAERKIESAISAAYFIGIIESCDWIYNPKSWRSTTTDTAAVEESNYSCQQFALYLSNSSEHLTFGKSYGLLSSSYDPLSTLPALCGRKVCPERVNYGLLIAWLRPCEQQHPETCTSVRSEKLKSIKLIDVHKRRVVDYPNGVIWEWPSIPHVILGYGLEWRADVAYRRALVELLN